MGKNINSERLASSNSLTQAALRMFYGNVDRFKHVLGDLFSAVHTDPNGTRVMFSKCLTQYDITALMPFLKAERVPSLYECAYHVPSSWFDVDRIRAVQLLGDDTSAKGPMKETPIEKLAKRDETNADSSNA